MVTADARLDYEDDPGPPAGWTPAALAANPLHDLWRATDGPAGPRRWTGRLHATRCYSWAVPSDDALSLLAAHAPLVEVCAGRGYWSALLRLRGVDVIATDAHAYDPTWTTVEIADAADAAAAHPERALMLVWPSWRTDTAARALAAYQGATVAYVGEPRGGQCASDAFFDALAREWSPIATCAIPRWSRTRDALTVYRRGVA